jgi:hypothetical protein
VAREEEQGGKAQPKLEERAFGEGYYHQFSESSFIPSTESLRLVNHIF